MMIVLKATWQWAGLGISSKVAHCCGFSSGTLSRTLPMKVDCQLVRISISQDFHKIFTKYQISNMALLSNIEYITISNIEYRIFHKYPTNGQISNKKSNIEYLQYLCLNQSLTRVSISRKSREEMSQFSSLKLEKWFFISLFPLDFQELKKINSQSLEDTQVGYISQKCTLDKNTSEKCTLKNTLPPQPCT